MPRRNDARINAVATIVLAKGDVTVNELVEQTGFSRAAVLRILNAPGFSELPGRYWPKRYKFNVSEAMNYQAITLDTEPTSNDGAVGESNEAEQPERDYIREVSTLPVGKVLRDLTFEAVSERTTDALNIVVDVYNNVQQFKEGKGKLDPSLTGRMNVNVVRAQKALETMYQFLERVKTDPDQDITWWEKFSD